MTTSDPYTYRGATDTPADKRDSLQRQLAFLDGCYTKPVPCAACSETHSAWSCAEPDARDGGVSTFGIGPLTCAATKRTVRFVTGLFNESALVLPRLSSVPDDGSAS